MEVAVPRRRRRVAMSTRARKRPRLLRDIPNLVSQSAIPALPSDVWMLIALHCDLPTKAAVAQVCRASADVSHMPNLQLARGIQPDISRTAALPFARTLCILADLLSVAPCMGVAGSGNVLRVLAGERGGRGEGFVSMETVRFFLGLTKDDLPEGIKARKVATPRSKCCVQHKGPAAEHAPGYRVECDVVYAMSDVLRALVAARGVRGVGNAVEGARDAVEVLEKRRTRGMEARGIVDEMLGGVGLREEDVAYIVGLHAVQDALFGLECSGLMDTLQRAVAVHKAVRPRYVWLWTSDGKARRKATLYLNKGLARGMETGELVRYMEGKFWWVTRHVASMPMHMRLAEVNEFGPFEPVSPADSSASSGADRGLQIPVREERALWPGSAVGAFVQNVTRAAPLN